MSVTEEERRAFLEEIEKTYLEERPNAEQVGPLPHSFAALRGERGPDSGPDI